MKKFCQVELQGVKQRSVLTQPLFDKLAGTPKIKFLKAGGVILSRDKLAANFGGASSAERDPKGSASLPWALSREEFRVSQNGGLKRGLSRPKLCVSLTP